MLWTPQNEWNLIIPSAAAARPGTAYGTLVTPVQNAYGSYASLIAGASVTHDVYEIWINVNSVGVSTVARDCIVTIGEDPAGGTTFADTILHLLASCAAGYNTQAGGIWYRFPYFIKAGTSIGAKASVNAVDLTAINVQVVLMCQPTRPDLIRAGSFIQTFGAVTASSCGTTVTPGGAAEGAYVELGTLDKALWFWEVGLGTNDSTMSSAAIHADLAVGDATNKRIAIQDALWMVTSSETMGKADSGACRMAASGEKVYGRCQSSVAADSAVSMTAYGVG